MYFEIQVKQHEHAPWKRDWVTGDRQIMDRLYRDIVISRDVHAVRLLSVTPPPAYTPREVLDYWEKK